MKNIKSQTEKKNIHEHISRQSFNKKIGNTTYIVNIRLSEQTKETFEDKIKRLVKKEVEAL